jgi:hypothetical protein
MQFWGDIIIHCLTSFGAARDMIAFEWGYEAAIRPPVIVKIRFCRHPYYVCPGNHGTALPSH